MKSIDFLKTGVLMFSIFLMGCQDDDISVTTDTTDDNRRIEIAGPAGDITYLVSDMIKDLDNEYVFVDEEGLVNVKYSRDVDIDWESLVNLRDYSQTWSYSPGIFFPINSAVNVDFTEKVLLNHRTDVRYDSLNMQGGVLSAYLMMPYGTEGDVTITLPEVLDNGNPLSYSFYASGNQRFFQIDEDLGGKKVIPSQGVDSSYISVITSLDLSNMVTGDVVLEFSLTEMQPGFAFGYFGQQESARPNEELTLDVFDELELIDEIEIYDFYIDLEVNSEIGVPFDVVTENMQFFDENDQLIDVLEVDGSNQIYLELDAAIYGDPIGMSETNFHISRDNSPNIVNIANSYPRRVLFDVISFSNPDGEGPESNFMGPSNVLQGTMNIVAPIWFNTTKDYVRTDTLDFDFNDILGDDSDDARELELATIWFDFYSKIPVDISASAWVVDADGNQIDNLFGNKETGEAIHVVEAGIPDVISGRVNEATHTEFSITVDGDQINEFLDRNAMSIILETRFFTGEDEFVKIYNDMSFNAVVSFEAAGKIPSF